tara:strand:+ start:3905 stop:4816 length:912 start_codon:yes stop_codon:yes gene_type:complete
MENNMTIDRTKFIGGSDIAGILNISDYTSPLYVWNQKVNGYKAVETEAVYFGKRLESFVKNEFSKKNKDLKVLQADFLTDEIREYLTGSPDGYVVDANGEVSILELKTTNEYHKKVWDNGVPDHYYAQVQWYMGLANLKKAYVACLAGGNKYYQYEVPFSQEFYDDAVAKAVRFWERYVIVGEMPAATEKSCDKKILGIEIENQDKDDVFRTTYVDEHISKLNELKKQEKELKKKISLLNNKVLEEMNGHKNCESHVFKIEYKTHSRKSVDSKKLQEDYPEIYMKVMKKSNFPQLSIKEKKNG